MVLLLFLGTPPELHPSRCQMLAQRTGLKP